MSPEIPAGGLGDARSGPQRLNKARMLDARASGHSLEGVFFVGGRVVVSMTPPRFVASLVLNL